MSFLKAKCTKFDFCSGSAPDAIGATYCAPPDSIAVFKGPTSKGRGREEEGNGKDGQGEWEKEMGGKGEREWTRSLKTWWLCSGKNKTFNWKSGQLEITGPTQTTIFLENARNCSGFNTLRDQLVLIRKSEWIIVYMQFGNYCRHVSYI